MQFVCYKRKEDNLKDSTMEEQTTSLTKRTCDFDQTGRKRKKEFEKAFNCPISSGSLDANKNEFISLFKNKTWTI